MTSPFPFVVNYKNGHKFSLSQSACPYAMWLQLYLSKGGLFLHPLMWAGLANCFAQWDISKCDTSISLQSICTWKFALLLLLEPPATMLACKQAWAGLTDDGWHMSSHHHWANPTNWPLTKGAWVSPTETIRTIQLSPAQIVGSRIGN